MTVWVFSTDNAKDPQLKAATHIDRITLERIAAYGYSAGTCRSYRKTACSELYFTDVNWLEIRKQDFCEQISHHIAYIVKATLEAF